MNSVVARIVVVVATAFLVGPASAEVPMPKPAKAYKGEKCVEPVETMRRYHMDYLMHQRDETVQQGIRGRKYSLTQCIECHATQAAGVDKGKSVGGKGESRTIEPFCANCHRYAAVTIDCFECHTASPAEAKAGKAKAGKAKAGKARAFSVQMGSSPPDARGSRVKNWIPAHPGMTARIQGIGKRSKAGKAWPAPGPDDRLVSELRAYLGDAYLGCERPVG